MYNFCYQDLHEVKGFDMVYFFLVDKINCGTILEYGSGAGQSTIYGAEHINAKGKNIRLMAVDDYQSHKQSEGNKVYDAYHLFLCHLSKSSCLDAVSSFNVDLDYFNLIVRNASLAAIYFLRPITLETLENWLPKLCNGGFLVVAPNCFSKYDIIDFCEDHGFKSFELQDENFVIVNSN